MKRIILIGGGGHALSALRIVNDCSIFVGYADIKPNENIQIPYLGTDADIIAKYSPEDYVVHHAVVYSNEVNLLLRQNIINKYRDYKAVSLISKSSIITSDSHIGDGTGVFHGVIINGSNIGNNCIINTGAIVEHNVNLGDNVFIGPNATVCGETNIGNNVLIGAGAIIKDGINICNDVVIGMGSIVTKDIKKSGVYIGLPASFLKPYFNE